MNYQWPQNFIKPSKYKLNISEKKNRSLVHKIENFFYSKFKIQTLLVPSARSGIALKLIAYFA